MADEADVLLQLYLEERTQARQVENQRATLTNMILVIAGLGFAFIGDRGLEPLTLTISLPMIALGLLGAASNAKYFERWHRHWQRSFAYQSQLLDRFPDIRDKRAEFSGEALRGVADKYEVEVDQRFPWRTRMKLHHMWVGLHLGVVVAGVVLSVLVTTQ